MKKSKKVKLPGAELENSLPTPTEPEDIMDDHEVKGHMQTMMDAHEIQNNPEKMAKVHKLAGRHMKAIQGFKMPESKINSTDGLRKLRNKKFGGPGGTPQGE